jgi:hypothetical protein
LPQVANLRYRIAAALVAAGWQPALLQRRRPSPQVANLRYRIAAAPVAQVFNLRHHAAPRSRRLATCGTAATRFM